MRTLAGTLRLLTTLTARGLLSAVLLSALLLSACDSSGVSQEVLANRCMPVSGEQEGELSITAPDEGTLRVGIDERGVSLVASFDDDKTSAAGSPVERIGTIVLLASSRRGQHHSVHIRVEDSPDIAGTFCVSAELIPASQRVRVRAEEAFALGGRATHGHDWSTAFAHYLNAARDFDRLDLKHSSAAARQAMAEIAYLRLDSKRESYALASEALADYGGGADSTVVGALTGLEGKALLDMPGMDASAVEPRVRLLFATARKYDHASPYGARELPRLDIMTGFLEYRLDAPGRARAVFADAARSCREMRDWDCYAIANQNLALLAAESNNYATALSAYADALRVLPPELDPKLSADIWDNYGRVQGIVGLFSAGERSHATAMRAYASLGDCPGVRRSLSWSGNLMVQIGTLSDAEDYLQQAASRQCSQLLAADYGSMAADKSTSARTPPCSQPLEASTLATDNKMIIFNSLLSLGGALMLEGESGLAQRCIDAAERYAATARSRMRLANARGAMLLESNDAPGSRSAFEQSVRIADDAKLPARYEYRGAAQLGLVKSALLAGDNAEAVRDGTQALKASVGRGDIDQTVTALRLLATGLRGSQQSAKAAHTLQTAADLIEGVPIDELDGEKRATYLATQYSVFAELTDLYASQATTDNEMAWLAFATSERGRARSLRYAVTQATRDASSALEIPPAARYQQLLRDVVDLVDSHAESGSTNLTDELDVAAKRERGPEEQFDREQLTRTLRQLEATLVEYVVGSRDMFALVVSDGNAYVVRLGDRREIAGAAAALHDLLRNTEAPASEVRTAAARLARLVLWPLHGRLAGKKIIFVPDDALHTVPFNVLPWSANAADNLVLHHAEVSSVPSALFLTRIRANNMGRSNAPRIELIGDPVFRILDWRHRCTEPAGGQLSTTRAARAVSEWTESLPRLPGSRAEVQMVARLARQSRPGSHIEMLLGCEAVPSALRRAAGEHIDLLHIATHARVDAQRPRLSAIALTPEGHDGMPTSGFGLLDILALKLNSNLVVLSACDTSRGRLLPGEGVLGPAQAFLQSGAAAVIASYWRVDDTETSNFMQRFYHYLLLDHLPAAGALRRAQLDQVAASPSYDWAAFALYGWPDSAL